MKKHDEPLHTTLIHLLQGGSIALPVVLLTEYRRLDLSEPEVMLLIQIMIFQEKEHIQFPSMEDMAERMSLSVDKVVASLRQMHKKGFLQIDQHDENGLLTEAYSFLPLWEKLAEAIMESSQSEELEQSSEDINFQLLFQLFEQELGRPLSPIECETLGQWIDEDQYPEQLIEAALQEAVFCGKMIIRYIDRILLDWKRNNVTSVEQAMEHARKFRQKGLLYRTTHEQPSTSKFAFYNWVNQE